MRLRASFSIEAALFLVIMMASTLLAQQYSNFPGDSKSSNSWYTLVFQNGNYVLVQQNSQTSGSGQVGREARTRPGDDLNTLFAHRMAYKWDLSSLPEHVRVNSVHIDFWYTSATNRPEATDVSVSIKSLSNDNWNTGSAITLWTSIESAPAYSTFLEPV